jgi:hypothetical protein
MDLQLLASLGVSRRVHGFNIDDFYLARAERSEPACKASKDNRVSQKPKDHTIITEPHLHRRLRCIVARSSIRMVRDTGPDRLLGRRARCARTSSHFLGVQGEFLHCSDTVVFRMHWFSTGGMGE